jgi:hypothetical protein
MECRVDPGAAEVEVAQAHRRLADEAGAQRELKG